MLCKVARFTCRKNQLHNVVSCIFNSALLKGKIMGNEKKGEEIVRSYRDECNNDVLVKILGEPIVALK